MSERIHTRTKDPSLVLMAVAIGLSVANPYYAQSLLPTFASTFKLTPGQVLLGPMLSQLGLAMGLCLLVPLGDCLERRRMLVVVALGMAGACAVIASSESIGTLLMGWYYLGLVSLIPSLLPPILAAITPEVIRGRMLGVVLSGQFTGILLSRSASGLMAELWGWRSIYTASAVAMMGVALIFSRQLPHLPSQKREGYIHLQMSQIKLWRKYPDLRRSCLTQALLFGSFMALWSAVSLHLAGPTWGFGPAAIGSFGLVGIVSIAGAPTIGRMVDRHGPHWVVTSGVLVAAIGVLLMGMVQSNLIVLMVGLMALDLGVQGSFVANQARIYGIDASARSRMSGQLFLTSYLGAATCTAVISTLWASWGWSGTCIFAISMVALAAWNERSTWWYKPTP